VAIYEVAAAGAVYRAVDPAFPDSRRLTVAMKLPILAADIGLAVLLWRIARRRLGERQARFALLAFWLNPASILAGTVLGYLDPLMALPAVAAILAAAAGWPLAAGVLLTIACLTKTQAIFAAPVVAIAVWNGTVRRRAAGAAAALAGGGVTFVCVLLPYAIAGALRNVAQGVASLLRHDMLSADAANLWWLVTFVMRASYAVKDLGAWAAWTMRVRILGVSRIVELGYPSPRAGATLAVAAAALWALWRARRTADPALLLGCAAFIVHAYFIFGVAAHENHMYLVIPLLAGAAAARTRLRPVLVGASAVVGLNLFLFYGLGRDFPLPRRDFTIVDSTVLLALVNCALLVFHARRFSDECARPQEIGV
jgi:hypothetical protein